MTDHDIPQERDLPTGRLTELKDELMAHIEQDLDSTPDSPPAVTSGRRWRRLGLAAAALAVFGIAASTMVGGNEPASANTAQRADDGSIIITLREPEHPKDLERRLNALGVPAVVDFLESGYGCDPARSTGWVRDGRAGSLFTWDDTPVGAIRNTSCTPTSSSPARPPCSSSRWTSTATRSRRMRRWGSRRPRSDHASRCPTTRSSTPRPGSPAADPPPLPHRGPRTAHPFGGPPTLAVTSSPGGNHG